MDKEFEDKCLKERTITLEPTVTTISRGEERIALAKRYSNNAHYFLVGARSQLQTTTSLLAILLGYFAMEHKTNQLLVLRGYKVESHICTQIALSRIIEQKDLARTLSHVFSERQKIGYKTFLTRTVQEQEHTKKILQETIEPFIKKIDELIKEMEEES